MSISKTPSFLDVWRRVLCFVLILMLACSYYCSCTGNYLLSGWGRHSFLWNPVLFFWLTPSNIVFILLLFETLPAFFPLHFPRPTGCSLITHMHQHSKWTRLIHLWSLRPQEPGSWPSWNCSLLCYITVVQPTEVNFHLATKHCSLSWQAGLRYILCKPHL